MAASRSSNSPTWDEERVALRQGYVHIAGLDEAGRGAAAGPVVAAIAILPFEMDFPGVRDSKLLSPLQREKAYQLVTQSALAWGTAEASPAEIDKLNILRATHLALRRCVEGMNHPIELALVDGLPVKPFPVKQRAVVGGDRKSYSIAAASILAKVTRDRLMVKLGNEYPGYGFELHKGYPTAEHKEAIERLGATPHHRTSWSTVSEALEPRLDLDCETHSQQMGRRGEDLAAEYVARLGWKLLARNYHAPGGELDLVALDGDTLVVIEVKARMAQSAIEAVDERKRSRILRATQLFIHERGHDGPVRFDVIEVLHPASSCPEIRWTRSAFESGLSL